MAPKKGTVCNPNGRPKGAPNKATTEFRTHLNKLLEESAPQMRKWLDIIAAEDPAKAFDILSKFAEYIHPKLSRQDTRFTDEDGNDKDFNITVEKIVYSAANKSQ